MYNQDCNAQHFETEHQQGYHQNQGFRAQEQLYGNNAPEHYANQEEHFVPQEHSQNQSRYSGSFPQYFSHKCHGSKAAIEMKPSQTKRGWHTVSLEAASSVALRKFDWGNKTIVQITKAELLPLIAVLLGIREKYDAKSHGINKDKGYSLQWQNKNSNLSLFCSLMEAKKKAMAVPVSAYDATMLGHLALSQYVLNYPKLTPESIIMSLKQVHRFPIK
ncbi:hypothetical protein [Shewanella sp. UCD-KL12]|uniref:hypothetical protein n=1 Tax=Shewanella sp. UCD-KL12 TaxID=1917163 RepID=UPI000970DD1A|nr:hypothetical protein [Shewanella sp. UCD-KL12]